MRWASYSTADDTSVRIGLVYDGMVHGLADPERKLQTRCRRVLDPPGSLSAAIGDGSTEAA